MLYVQSKILEIKNAIEEFISIPKDLQILMNEPSVNLRLLHLFKDQINAEFPQLNDRGIYVICM